MWERIKDRVRFVSAIGTLAGWAWRVFLWVFGLTAAGVMAWLSTTWEWYWATFNWFGTGIAFLATYLLLGVGTLIWALSASYLRRGTASAPEDEGPLVWFTNLTLEGGGMNPIYSLRFHGTNASQREVEIVSADITSAIDGTRIQLEVVAVSAAGINEVVPLGRIQLVPPGAPIELVAKLNPPNGLDRGAFLATWRQFFVNVRDDTRAYRHAYNEGSLMPFFPGHVGPRVRQKPEPVQAA